MNEPEAHWRKKEFFELAVFLLLIIPSMMISFLPMGKERLGFAVMAVSIILRDISLTCLVFFFLWRDGEPLSRLGWKFGRLKEEIALGAILILPVLYAEPLLVKVFQWFGLSSAMSRLPQFLTPKGLPEIFLACILAAVAAVAEETIFRGYLLLRLNDLTGSTIAAVLISSVLFSLGHGYEGAASVGTVGVLGLLLALTYVWRKSLVAPAVLHFLIDFFPLVLLPLFKLK
ncbi:MAG: CPBP family intramembrane glutamic endopeptidase [Syntrophobacteraceae bacterium]